MEETSKEKDKVHSQEEWWNPQQPRSLQESLK